MRKWPNKLYEPRVENLGDFLNGLPVVSGISKAIGEPVKFVVNPALRKINGFREFMEFQPFISELVYRDEMVIMDEKSYLTLSYADNEFKELTERPLRPIETMRWKFFVNTYYPQLKWEVDDDLVLQVYDNYMCDDPLFNDYYFVGDRWNQVIDKRRDWEILANSLLFVDGSKFFFLPYDKFTIMDCAWHIKFSSKPFISTFTGSGMLGDLLKKETWCVYDDSMIPLWNGMPIEYSYWKHFYKNRNNRLVHINHPSLRML